jgi:hypothetical protein
MLARTLTETVDIWDFLTSKPAMTTQKSHSILNKLPWL